MEEAIAALVLAPSDCLLAISSAAAAFSISSLALVAAYLAFCS